jgi:hypothetical protein
MGPKHKWRKRYAGWPALKKLEYVDGLMEEIGDAKPGLTTRAYVDPVSTLNFTLAEYYEQKQARYMTRPPTVHDRDLKRIFSDDPRHRHAPKASTFLRENGPEIRRMVAKWTGQYQLTLDALLDEMIARCRALKLRAAGPQRRMMIDFTVLLTAKTVHALHSPSRRWFAL